MARGKSDTVAVEGQEVRKDERAVEWDGREMRSNGWRIMWVERSRGGGEGEGGRAGGAE